MVDSASGQHNDQQGKRYSESVALHDPPPFPLSAILTEMTAQCHRSITYRHRRVRGSLTTGTPHECLVLVSGSKRKEHGFYVKAESTISRKDVKDGEEELILMNHSAASIRLHHRVTQRKRGF